MRIFPLHDEWGGAQDYLVEFSISYGRSAAEEVVSIALWCWKGELRSKVIECTAATAVKRDVDGRVGGTVTICKFEE